jgi:hypothetical protein
MGIGGPSSSRPELRHRIRRRRRVDGVGLPRHRARGAPPGYDGASSRGHGVRSMLAETRRAATRPLVTLRDGFTRPDGSPRSCAGRPLLRRGPVRAEPRVRRAPGDGRVAAHRHRAGGDAFARAVRADLAVRETPLVAVTGYGQPEDRRLATEAGFSAHLVKPVRVEARCRPLARLSGTPRVEPGGL